jgi:hypothetical protein
LDNIFVVVAAADDVVVVAVVFIVSELHGIYYIFYEHLNLRFIQFSVSFSRSHFFYNIALNCKDIYHKKFSQTHFAAFVTPVLCD